MPTGRPKRSREERKGQKQSELAIAELWFQGNSQHDIMEKLGFEAKYVTRVLRQISAQLEPKTVRAIEYRRNKCLAKIRLVQKKAWEINEEERLPAEKRLAALRVVTSSQELEAKIEGITQEKIVIKEAEKEAGELLKELKKLEEKEAKSIPEDSGIKEPNADTIPLPAFLKDAFKDNH
jgi:hypothetical protein